MTDTGDAQKTIDDDVLNALPCSCWLPSEYGTIFLVATAVLPKLRKIMTDEQIIAAHEGTDPELLAGTGLDHSHSIRYSRSTMRCLGGAAASVWLIRLPPAPPL